MLQPGGQVNRRDDVSDVCRGVCADDTRSRREDDKKRHDGDQAKHLWQDEIAGGVDAHDFQGVDLLCHAHGTQL